MTSKFGKSGGLKWRWLAVLAAAASGYAGQSAQAAVAGAWETFFDKHNTDAWVVYDYSTPIDKVPLWSGTPVNDEYAYFNYTGNNAVGFSVDSRVASGAFVGDYVAQKIAGISYDVYIGDLAVLEYIECAVYGKGPKGLQWYSSYYYASDFSRNGWWTLLFSFSNPWWYWNEATQAWIEVPPTVFTDVEEIQLTFGPKASSTGGTRVGIDNVTLEPTVAAPQTTPSVTTAAPRNFRLAFTPGPGLESRVEKLRNPPASGWEAVTGQTGIKAPGEHVFLTPVSPGAEIFRVAAEPFYTMVFTP